MLTNKMPITSYNEVEEEKAQPKLQYICYIN